MIYKLFHPHRKKAGMVLFAKMVESLVNEKARTALDQTEYNRKYNALIERYETAKNKREDIEKQISDVQRRVQEMGRFIENVRNLGAVSEFDAELWGLLVEKVVVYGKDDLRVEFRK